ncbi:MAG: CHAD domain-containing protein [Pseudoxanthomonas sp.]
MNAASEEATITVGDALRGVAEAQLSQAADFLARKGGHRHSGVHQGRKSIRRVRSILTLAAVPLGPGADALNHLLSAINQDLSRSRDAQALVEAIDHFAARTRNGKWLALLARARKNAVSARRVVLQEAMAADPDFMQARTLLMQTRDALGALPWIGVTVQEVEAAFSTGRKQTRKAAARAAATHDDEDWHGWRRKARRQSQQQKILAEVGIASHVRYDDKGIALLLGQQQDCSLLLAFCETEQSPIRWTDRNQLNHYIGKKLRSLRKKLAGQSVHA